MSKIKGPTEAKPGVAGKAFGVVEAVAKKETDRVVAVRAVRIGFYGNARRRIGAEFNIVLAPGEKMPSWLVEASAAPSPQAEVEAAPGAESESADVI